MELFREKHSIIILNKKSNNSHNCVLQSTPWPGHFVSQTIIPHLEDTAAAKGDAEAEANIPKWEGQAQGAGWQIDWKCYLFHGGIRCEHFLPRLMRTSIPYFKESQYFKIHFCTEDKQSKSHYLRDHLIIPHHFKRWRKGSPEWFQDAVLWINDIDMLRIHHGIPSTSIKT